MQPLNNKPEIKHMSFKDSVKSQCLFEYQGFKMRLDSEDNEVLIYFWHGGWIYMATIFHSTLTCREQYEKFIKDNLMAIMFGSL